MATPKKRVEARSQFGALYAMILETFPQYRTEARGVFDVDRLAADLAMTTEGVYKWFRADRITRRGAEKIIELANRGRKKNPALELADFLPYLS